MNQSKNKLLQTSASHTHTIWKDPPDSREFIESYLESDPVLYISYRRMTSPYRERLLDFLRGAKTLPLTYDPFFKTVFDPVLHPERLSGLISSLLGIPVKVKDVLPAEDRMLDGESLLIMDVLVELEDGSLTNVEIQKIPYAFPAERMSCYSSDLVMRQYARAKSLRGKDFSIGICGRSIRSSFSRTAPISSTRIRAAISIMGKPLSIPVFRWIFCRNTAW